jgi:hypothetical protein
MRSVDAAAPRLIVHTEGGRVRAECSRAHARSGRERHVLLVRDMKMDAQFQSKAVREETTLGDRRPW